MSGIFSFGSDRMDVLFLLGGVVGAVLFFLLYPGQHPVSTADIPTDSDDIELRSVEWLSQMGYSLTDYDTRVRLRSYSSLLDSLQRKLGRARAIEVLNSGERGVIRPFYWQVVFENPFSRGEDQAEGELNVSTGEPGPRGEDGGRSFYVRFGPDGQFLELRNGLDQLPDPVVSRQAVTSIFTERPDTLQSLRALSRSDSLLTRYLYFDLGQPEGETESRLLQMQRNFSRDVPFRINRSEAEAMARHHLERSGWAGGSFVPDTIFIERVQNYNTAVVRLHTQEPVHGQRLRLDVQVAPTGTLLELTSAWNPEAGGSNGWGGIWRVLEDALVILFLLATLILFFYRIRARAVDSRSALVAAIVAGLSFAGYVLLGHVNQINLFGNASEQFLAMMLLIVTGISGAAAAVAFFILFATSDSITRQYWPSKLATYDYIRQGMIFNKPVGSVLLRSMVLAFSLAGAWALLLWLLPRLYISIPGEGVFLQGSSGWPPLYLLVYNGWFSLSAVLGIFLILGGLVWSRTGSRWLTGAVTVLACGLYFPVNLGVGPTGQEFLLGAMLGVLLTLIYLKWDFSTLLISLFFFLGLLKTASGWLAPSSPDLYIFVTYLVLLVLLAMGGVLAIFLGKEEKVLPRYVPEYVEELAQEERIRQELQIAREVQQSFLPTRIPEIGKLDLAAVCQPAYETGGDYYDFIRLDEHRIGVAIGDVSGKGIQAAFYMTFIKGIMHSLCRETDSPAELLRKTNRLFFDNAQRGTFISLVYGILDTRGRTFTFARAGHNPVLHFDRSEDRMRDLQPGGLGIGLTREDSFDHNIRDHTVDLEGEDILLLYTDGIVEALNVRREFYGAARLKERLRALSSQTSRGILDRLADDVRTFIGEARQHDDMTMVVIRFG